MRRLFTITCLILASLAAAGCSHTSEEALKLVNTKAPYTRVTMLDGSYIPLTRYRGRTLALLFWATWFA